MRTLLSLLFLSCVCSTVVHGATITSKFWSGGAVFSPYYSSVNDSAVCAGGCISRQRFSLADDFGFVVNSGDLADIKVTLSFPVLSVDNPYLAIAKALFSTSVNAGYTLIADYNPNTDFPDDTAFSAITLLDTVDPATKTYTSTELTETWIYNLTVFPDKDYYIFVRSYGDFGNSDLSYNLTVQTIPIPGAVWLYATGLIGALGFKRKQISGSKYRGKVLKHSKAISKKLNCEI